MLEVCACVCTCTHLSASTPAVKRFYLCTYLRSNDATRTQAIIDTNAHAHTHRVWIVSMQGPHLNPHAPAWPPLHARRAPSCYRCPQQRLKRQALHLPLSCHAPLPHWPPAAGVGCALRLPLPPPPLWRGTLPRLRRTSPPCLPTE